MIIYSFDVFDTCLIRKCGTHNNMLNVLSQRVFCKPVEECVRQEFIVARCAAEDYVWKYNEYGKLADIYRHLDFSHPFLLPTNELENTEIYLEEELLVPVLSRLEQIKQLHSNGHSVIFISDMYLPENFIKRLLVSFGFFIEGDSLFISSECGMTKSSGFLFEHIRKVYRIKPHKWHHFGDNIQSDYKVPKKLGIKAHIVHNDYLPYERQWLQHGFDFGDNVCALCAGLGRALHYSMADNPHKDFVIDIIAPFYSSFVMRIMKDAEARGIKRLYFCARDSYTLFLVAQKYERIFPNVEVLYLFVSQKSLYEGDPIIRMRYFEQIGLASAMDYVAIVDIRSSGHQLISINDELVCKGYNQIRGYFFEIFCDSKILFHPSDYYAEINRPFVERTPVCNRIVSFWHVYEGFFSIHTQKRTIGYKETNDKIVPVFYNRTSSDDDDNKDFFVSNSLKWSEIHNSIILTYVENYISLGLYKFSDTVFETIVTRILASFFDVPERHYLVALCDFYIGNEVQGSSLPYVKRESLAQILFTKGKDTYWKRGTLFLSVPSIAVNLYKRKHLDSHAL